MPTSLNHTIVYCHDNWGSARFLAELLDRPNPTGFGPFAVVALDNDVSLDFLEGEVHPQHYAFLVGEDDFDQVHARIRDRDLTYWADPARSQQGQVNTRDGGRGLYWEDPNGHLLEILTVPYGGWG